MKISIHEAPGDSGESECLHCKEWVMVAVEIEFIGSDEGADCTWLCLSCLRKAVEIGTRAETESEASK